MTGSAAAGPDAMLATFLAGQPRLDLDQGGEGAAEGSQAVVHAPELLQDEPDYRSALQRWFALLQVGGLLVLTVPHAFLDTRQDRMPAPRRPRQQRLYTPASLLAEVEEALVPNSYRLRWLADRDGGYDYARDRATPPTGQHDIALVLERIASPAWDLAPARPAAKPAPGPLFEPLRTRAETMATERIERILVLKLDHLGDFIMALPALRAIRRHFPGAHITLVVANWNEALAKRVAIADELLIFDAFPRNAEEATVDVAGKTAQFDELVTGQFDLAIDLRTISDTRALLRNVRARHKAGIGIRGAHPFMDIFLPLDPNGERVDHAWAETIGPSEFLALTSCVRTPFQIGAVNFPIHAAEQILVWGPYRDLTPGDYMFQPFIDLGAGRPGALAYDVAVGSQRIAYGVFDGQRDLLVPFTVPENLGLFEFRLCTLAGEPGSDFHFYGGRLIKKGAGGTLHQAEYLALLVELTAMRLNGTILRDTKDGAR